jgi:hypothetical protein
LDQRFSTEHSRLLRSARTVLGDLSSVEKRLQFGDSESMWHREWARRAAWLHGHLLQSGGLYSYNKALLYEYNTTG